MEENSNNNSSNCFPRTTIFSFLLDIILRRNASVTPEQILESPRQIIPQYSSLDHNNKTKPIAQKKLSAALSKELETNSDNQENSMIRFSESNLYSLSASSAALSATDTSLNISEVEALVTVNRPSIVPRLNLTSILNHQNANSLAQDFDYQSLSTIDSLSTSSSY